MLFQDKFYNFTLLNSAKPVIWSERRRESGFVFSVSQYSPPSIVEKFTSKLKIYGKEHAYVFEIMTYGGEEQYF